MMQPDDDLLTRRHFLQWSASAALASAALPSLSQDQPAEGHRRRTASPHSVVLRNGALAVTFDSTDGLPIEYHLLANGAKLQGEDSGTPVQATLCQRNAWTFHQANAEVERYTLEGAVAVFHMRSRVDGRPGATFDLDYQLDGSTLTVALKNVKEAAGMELINVSFPRLVTVSEHDEQAWLAHGEQGGSFVRLADAKAGSLPLNSFWGNVLSTFPFVMIGTAKAMCVQETTSFMDGTLLSVSGPVGNRSASLGTDKVYRVNGSACYDLNLGKGLPRNCGNEHTPNLLVEQQSSCRLDFMPIQGATDKAWIAAGKMLRQRMPKIPTDFYNDKYVYGLRCDEPLFPEPSTTFAQCEDFIARVAVLTDHSPQVVHLWGWQFRGKDTGYPAVNEVNPRIGGYEGMMRLMENARAHNAIVTLSDNYDDAYRSSPAWDEAIIARRPDGALWKSRSWTGEESYIMGLAKYMQGPGPERIRYTCERYALRHTTHIDVLSYYAIRNDWDPQHPASGIRNLEQGRYKVIEGFRARGVDVSSEAMRYPMIGHISCFWYLTGPGPCPFGGTAIPLVPLVYGNSAVWGLSGAGAKGEPAFVRILERFYGAAPHSTLRHDTPQAQFLDAFYLGMVPFMTLRGRAVEDFDRDGDSSRITLERGAVIESDAVAKRLRITLDGVEILRDDVLLCPFPRHDMAGAVLDRMACYSPGEQRLDVTLPRGWQARDIVAVRLRDDSRVPAELTFPGGNKVQLLLHAREPVMLYRDKSAANAASPSAMASVALPD